MGKGLFDEATRLPKWAVVALFVGLVIIFIIGPNIPNAGVVQLETALLQVNGFLLAFVSVAFTGMVTQVRSQNDLTIEQRRKRSKQITVESLRSFTLLIVALIASVAILATATAFPNGYTPEYLAYLFPLIFTVFGLWGIFVAMISFAKMDDLAVDHV